MQAFAGKRAEEEFWSSEEGQQVEKSSGITAFPGESYVDAGLLAYSNFGEGKDEFTAGFKINASFRDLFEYIYLRVDGFLGVDGPAEGMAEVDFSLIRGLSAGIGLSYTKRLDFSPRFGLYVEDQDNSARRGGFYLLRDEGGGIELGWPLTDQWSAHGDFGIEKENDDKYTRLLAGVLYRF